MSSNGGASTFGVADKTLARRRYFREKQRAHRRKLNSDGAIVKAQVEHLQPILDGLQASMPPSSMAPREASDGPLSWHSIAIVFKREAHRVLTDRQSLITQTQEYQSLTKAMQRFVMMNIPSPMSRSNHAWHSATLAANPSARNLGKEWLTQHMYHNIHEPFTLLPAASYHDDFFKFDIQASDDSDPITGVERMQFSWPGTVQMFRRLVVEETTPNTRLFRTITPKGIFVNSLQGHFVEANRFIVVMRQVEHDEAHLCDPLHKQQHNMSWCVRTSTEVRQVSPTHILLRVVSHVSHIFRPGGGFVSVDEFAALRGVDVTGIQDDQKDAYVRRELIRRENSDFVPWVQGFMGLMH
ncbi:hypothetical protein DYB30_007099 [Aphanomyces astaci]|uniref:Uncharacterized protein n=1 Tax=Aphanomyces astaci TaxID=112090 RepID=A0A397DQL9_APHAT|nr:hypothetical protein DYB30_007099 [Aphanomyces astaci]